MIRLARIGKKKQPTYRLIISEKTKDTFGDVLEFLGNYNPQTQPRTITLKADRIKYWLSKGAQASATVHNLLVDEKIIPGPKIKATTQKHKNTKTQKTEEKLDKSATEEIKSQDKSTESAKPVELIEDNKEEGKPVETVEVKKEESIQLEEKLEEKPVEIKEEIKPEVEPDKPTEDKKEENNSIEEKNEEPAKPMTTEIPKEEKLAEEKEEVKPTEDKKEESTENKE